MYPNRHTHKYTHTKREYSPASRKTHTFPEINKYAIFPNSVKARIDQRQSTILIIYIIRTLNKRQEYLSRLSTRLQ
jgi:hypothetical protein